MMKSYANKHLV